MPSECYSSKYLIYKESSKVLFHLINLTSPLKFRFKGMSKTRASHLLHLTRCCTHRPPPPSADRSCESCQNAGPRRSFSHKSKLTVNYLIVRVSVPLPLSTPLGSCASELLYFESSSCHHQKYLLSLCIHIVLVTPFVFALVAYM